MRKTMESEKPTGHGEEAPKQGIEGQEKPEAATEVKYSGSLESFKERLLAEALVNMRFDSLEAMKAQLVTWGFREDAVDIVDTPNNRDERYKRRLILTATGDDYMDEAREDGYHFNGIARDLIRNANLPERLEKIRESFFNN